MAVNNMNVMISTFGAVMFEGDANAVIVPGMDGVFEISHDHIPVCSKIGAGNIKLVDKGESFHIDGGICIFENNKLSIFVSRQNKS